MLQKMIRAAMLDVNFYEEVEADQTLTTEAITVVVIVSIISGLGGALLNLFRGHPGAMIMGLIGGLIMALVGYFVWSFVVYIVGVNLFHGTADYGELLRTIGYAYSPNVLGFFTFIPVLGWLIAFVGSIWALVAGVIAVRQALDFDTTKAILTVLIGWVVMVIVVALIAGVFGLGAGVMGSL
jgi:hypothetical protein